MVSIGRQKFGTDLQLMFRILKGLLFLGFVSVMAVLFVVCNLTISDVFACILGFLPTGWCILLVSKASIYLLLSYMYMHQKKWSTPKKKNRTLCFLPAHERTGKRHLSLNTLAVDWKLINKNFRSNSSSSILVFYRCSPFIAFSSTDIQNFFFADRTSMLASD
jgi:hypothetical protein